jgi:hypothetical protein
MSDTEMDMGTPEPNPGSRELAINLNTSEIIMVDLDMLEENPDELLNVLMEGQSSVYVWTQLANEYISRGLLESAEKILRTGERRRCPPRSLGVFARWLTSTRRIQRYKSSRRTSSFIFVAC